MEQRIRQILSKNVIYCCYRIMANYNYWSFYRYNRFYGARNQFICLFAKISES